MDSLNDNARRRLVEATELAGPDCRDTRLVFAGAGKAPRASKDFAYQDQVLSERMSLPMLTIESDSAKTPGARA